jgi:hypothetical protein
MSDPLDRYWAPFHGAKMPKIGGPDSKQLDRVSPTVARLFLCWEWKTGWWILWRRALKGCMTCDFLKMRNRSI